MNITGYDVFLDDDEKTIPHKVITGVYIHKRDDGMWYCEENHNPNHWDGKTYGPYSEGWVAAYSAYVKLRPVEGWWSSENV